MVPSTLAAEISVPATISGSPDSAPTNQNIYNLPFLLPNTALVPTRDLGNLSVIITPQRAHVSCSLNNVDMPKSRTMLTISKQYQFLWLTARNQHNAKVLVKSLNMNSDGSANLGGSVSPIQLFLLLKVCK